ncbi:hypothetical protein [Burkholderia sp. BCC0322]|uniref:hypothetical protein n=1 Tax=Burkholderia sp. BCC0322 TaxID=2676296 RepID=UPI001589E9B3|nr:hypothetical protein [Burkholderia sp. BCC0322]
MFIYRFSVNKLLLALFLTLNGDAAFSLILPANTVYRVDDRDPSVIFINGFASWGRNASIDAHVSGDSVREQTSSWISTTSNFDSAVRIAGTRFNLNPSSRNRVSWIYEIAQTNNMYDFNRIIQNEQSGWFLSDERRDHLNALRMRYEAQSEIGALSTISPYQIVRARRFVWDSASGRGRLDGGWENNSRYDEVAFRNTSMNTGLYSFSNTNLLRSIIGVASTVSFYSASWCVGHNSQPGRSLSRGQVCGDPEPLEYKDNEVLMSQRARTNYFPYDEP